MSTAIKLKLSREFQMELSAIKLIDTLAAEANATIDKGNTPSQALEVFKDSLEEVTAKRQLKVYHVAYAAEANLIKREYTKGDLVLNWLSTDAKDYVAGASDTAYVERANNILRMSDELLKELDIN